MKHVKRTLMLLAIFAVFGFARSLAPDSSPAYTAFASQPNTTDNNAATSEKASSDDAANTADTAAVPFLVSLSEDGEKNDTWLDFGLANELGKTYTDRFFVKNLSNEELSLDLEAADIGESNLDDKYKATDWLTIVGGSSRKIPAHEMIAVNLRLKVPSESVVDGSHYLRLVIKGNGAESNLKLKITTTTKDASATDFLPRATLTKRTLPIINLDRKVASSVRIRNQGTIGFFAQCSLRAKKAFGEGELSEWHQLHNATPDTALANITLVEAEATKTNSNPDNSNQEPSETSTEQAADNDKTTTDADADIANGTRVATISGGEEVFPEQETTILCDGEIANGIYRAEQTVAYVNAESKAVVSSIERTILIMPAMMFWSIFALLISVAVIIIVVLARRKRRKSKPASHSA
ncbi:hypothetical protein IKF15_01445 [Candidatus Saccharibacteria bacterium]|nr:hypothetical protein [Candidatus Saccharibacteria bacterium]